MARSTEYRKDRQREALVASMRGGLSNDGRVHFDRICAEATAGGIRIDEYQVAHELVKADLSQYTTAMAARGYGITQLYEATLDQPTPFEAVLQAMSARRLRSLRTIFRHLERVDVTHVDPIVIARHVASMRSRELRHVTAIAREWERQTALSWVRAIIEETTNAAESGIETQAG